jgi:hypothetical protein
MLMFLALGFALFFGRRGPTVRFSAVGEINLSADFVNIFASARNKREIEVEAMADRRQCKGLG